MVRRGFAFHTSSLPTDALCEQLATKSGIWFWDARPAGVSPALFPVVLPARLARTTEQLSATTSLGNRTGRTAYARTKKKQSPRLKPLSQQVSKTYFWQWPPAQQDPRPSLMYDLLRRKRVRRILFLVDRNALGRRALDARARLTPVAS
jgi:type I restriction enzyme R subunit